MKRILTLLCAVCCVYALSAQKVVEKYSLLSKAEIQQPFMIDSLDNNGKAFNILKDFKSLSADKNKATAITVDENGYLVFDKQEKAYIVSLGFRVKNDKRENLKFSIISDCAFKADFVEKSKDKDSESLDTIKVKADYNQGIYDMTINLLVR